MLIVPIRNKFDIFLPCQLCLFLAKTGVSSPESSQIKKEIKVKIYFKVAIFSLYSIFFLANVNASEGRNIHVRNSIVIYSK